jgi:hypothetical protein
MVKKIVLTVLTIAIVMAGIAILWLFISGHLALVTKQPKDAVVAEASVCGDEIIAKFNSAFEAEDINNYKTRLKEVYGEVSALEDSDTDPNCVFVKASYNMDIEQYDAARENVAALRKLEEDNKYVTTKMVGAQNATLLQRALDATTNSTSVTPDSSEQPANSTRSNGQG